MRKGLLATKRRMMAEAGMSVVYGLWVIGAVLGIQYLVSGRRAQAAGVFLGIALFTPVRLWLEGVPAPQHVRYAVIATAFLGSLGALAFLRIKRSRR